MSNLREAFQEVAKEAEGTVAVNISYDIISQISMQLYTNPRKAIEELVCNSYDAGATECHVKIPKSAEDGLAVLDNGVSMDLRGLQYLWLVGVSPKQVNYEDYRVDNRRVQIGKFGVGKLAAFSLGGRLTHISNKGGWTRLVSVGQAEIKDESGGRPPTFEVFKIPEGEARSVLEPHLRGLPKPWERGWDSWTLALVDEVHEATFGRALKIGILRRMISTALPVSAKFQVYLEGDTVPRREVDPSKIVVEVDVATRTFKKRTEKTLQAYWGTRLGVDELDKVPKSHYRCELGEMLDPEDVDRRIPALRVPHLGPISGKAIVAAETLTTGKLEERGYRNNGFAIYVQGKLINPEDELFGITQRTHMYWRRFLALVEIPGLDRALLVQRNSVSENRDETLIAREVLKDLFNYTRRLAEEEEFAEEYVPQPFGSRFRVLSPLVGPVALRGLAGDSYPSEGLDALDVGFATFGEGGPAARFDTEEVSILVNEEHPLVALVADMGKRGQPLRQVLGEVIAGTIMAFGYLRARGVDDGLIREAQDIIDDSLRSAAGYLEDEIEVHIEEIEEASYEGGARFERAVARAFRRLRLAARWRGGKDEPDAIIEIPEAAAPNLCISVEDKGSKGVITHKELSEATISRHRDEAGCTHAIAIARKFQTEGLGEKESALLRETKGKVPLITTAAIVKILKLHRERPFTHAQVKKILTTWTYPDELEDFIESVWEELPEPGLLSEILDIAYEIQDKDAKNYPEPGMILANEDIRARGLTRPELVQILEAVSTTTQMIIIRDPAIHQFELLAPPDTILEVMAQSRTSRKGVQERGE